MVYDSLRVHSNIVMYWAVDNELQYQVFALIFSLTI